MSATVITTDDLRLFKLELLDEIREIFEDKKLSGKRKWLRSQEVREMLGISPGTLQNLRINGTIPYTKIGGVLYYDSNEINTVLERNRVHNTI
ncbi:helix-turn-helix domain-containing protein [Robiginitalea sp. M366]|uniref:helix-turn-helix domain-containing protein n=1 Tax=Robiginitalea aestuariiviva TaxID=3036903 RepID=UPI00240E6A00|nr:helix-turn-helix domain-containing protein [Robiginitalea aestuariiviva]MDG1573307.1 helix-turn-helix domain-containing protein [Robiginitalea aestuariiviva]